MDRRLHLIETRTKSPLKGLNPLLVSWTQTTIDFCRRRNFEDNCWWYNERASLSILAGAAWRIKGWSALEEFSTTKRGVVPENELDPGRIVRGRCDLLLAHASSDYAVEAKQVWQPIGRRARVNRVKSGMQKAWQDVGNLTHDEGDHRLALTFVAPYIPLCEVGELTIRGAAVVDEVAVRDVVESWLKGLDLSVMDAYAYAFPRVASGFVNDAQKYVFPGSLICVRKRKKANRQSRSL
jgi:hypothetical protein